LKEYPHEDLLLHNIKGERWKDIPGLEGYFQISNFHPPNGNYIETRQGPFFNGYTYGAQTLDKNSPTQKVEEQKYKTEEIQH